jgi:integration host factor subunit beta
MSTTTKRDLIERIAEETHQSRTAVKEIVQAFLNQVIRELSEGNRLEFRDFGVFELRQRAERVAQNPKTLEPVTVPASNTVKFKAGRLMKRVLDGELDAEALTPVSRNNRSRNNRRAAKSEKPDYEIIVGNPGQR